MSPRFGMHRAAQVRNPAKPHTGVASNDGIRWCGLFEYWRWSDEVSSRRFPELFSPLSHVVYNPVVTVDHLEFAGAAVGSGNGAGIRYEGGTLTVTNSWFHDNQNGILGNSVPSGAVNIANSEFDHNGFGDGQTHNLYIGNVSSFSFTNSYSHDAYVGHELKSRADTTVITNSRFDDGNGPASYSIDMPDGGAVTIQNNIIRQGPNSGNSNRIDYAEE